VKNSFSSKIQKPSRKKAVIFNLLSHYTNIILVVVQGIILVPLYLSHIDARLYGAWLATGNIVAYLELLDFGFYSIIVQKIAKMAGEGNEKHLGQLMGTSLVVTLILSVFPFCLGNLLYQHIPGWVNIHGPDAVELGKSVLIASAATSLMFLAYGFGGILVGLQWVGVVGWQFIAASFLGIVATVAFFFMGWGIVSIAMGLLVRAAFMSAGHMIYLLMWIHRHMPAQSLSFKKTFFKELYKGSSWILVSRLANTAATQSDNLIVATVLDPRLTTILSLTRKSADIIMMILMRIPSSFMPGIAHLSGEADKAKLKKYAIILTKVILVIGLWSMGGMLFLNEDFVRLWVGSEFYGGILLTFLIALACFLLVVNNVMYHNIFAVGEIQTAAKATMFEALLRIPSSIIFCQIWGIKGVVLAGILAALPTSFFMQLRCFLNVLKLSWRKIVPTFVRILFQSVVPIATGYIIHLYWIPQNLPELFLFIVAYLALGVIYYGWIDNDFRIFMNKILKKVAPLLPVVGEPQA